MNAVSIVAYAGFLLLLTVFALMLGVLASALAEFLDTSDNDNDAVDANGLAVVRPCKEDEP